MRPHPITMFARHAGEQRRRSHGVVISEGQVRAVGQAFILFLKFEMRMGGETRPEGKTS